MSSKRWVDCHECKTQPDCIRNFHAAIDSYIHLNYLADSTIGSETKQDYQQDILYLLNDEKTPKLQHKNKDFIHSTVTSNCIIMLSHAGI